MPELPEVETVRRGLDAYVVGRRIVAAEFRGARVVRRHVPGAADLSARVEQSVVTGARRRGKYLWLVLREPADGHDQGAADAPGDERPAARPAPGRRGGEAPARAVLVRRRPDRAAVRRPADLRRRGAGRARRPGHPGADRPHRARPARGGVGRGGRRGADEGPQQRRQAVPARPVAGQRDRQHLRRRGPVARRDPRRAPREPAHQTGSPPAAGPRPRGHGRGARAGRHELRRALRQRQRVVGVLRPVAGRVRAGGPAVPPLRDADPP